MHEKNVEIGYLLDFYGKLLNDRKKDALDMYYNSDMSLSEISEELGITRQGVRDLINKGGNELLSYEEKLGMARKFREIEAAANALRETSSKGGCDSSTAVLLAEKIIRVIND